jgi:F-type H+-transporting ATPase subunit gamma
MPTLEGMKRRLEATGQLESVVRTMKTLAAVNIRQYEEAVAALNDYTRTIELGFHILFRDPRGRRVVPRSGPAQRLGAVVYGSDQGMCGQFNESLARHLAEALDRMRIARAERRVLAIGERAAAALGSTRQPVRQTFGLPGSTSGITPIVQRVLGVIEHWRAEERIDAVVLFYNEYARSTYRPSHRRLLPLDAGWIGELQERRWATRSLPTFSVEWEQLFSLLVRQYVFAWLYRALVESLAAENAARLRSMQAAEKNVAERLGELEREYHQARQSAITAELLDIVVGSASLE